MSTANITLNGGLPLLPKQEQLMTSQALVNFIGGGWGSGKTRGACLAFLANCIHPGNGWNPSYGTDRPFSLMVAPTHKVLKDSAYRELRAICPEQLILREWKSPDWEILLANGHMIKFRTIRGSLEGASAVTIMVDEIHMVPNEKIWLNYQARARDPRAAKRMVIASGLPLAGWLQGVFDGHEDDPNRLSIFCSSEDNHYLPTEVIEQFRRSAPGKAARQYIDGRWATPEDRVYFNFDPRKNRTKRPIDRSIPVLIGMDVGDKSAVLFCQEITVQCKSEKGRITPEKGLMVVDEMRPANKSTEQVCRLIRDRGWHISEKSAVFTDPTIRKDEIAAYRSVFPRLSLIKSSRRGGSDSTEVGHHCVNAAFCDADGNTRLFFHQDLPRGPDSLYHSVLSFRRGKNGRPIRDDKVDHLCDALRYVVSYNLPVTRTAHEIRPRF